MAIGRRYQEQPSTSALPPTADIQDEVSAFDPIMSALAPQTDIRHLGTNPQLLRFFRPVELYMDPCPCTATRNRQRCGCAAAAVHGKGVSAFLTPPPHVL